MVNFQAINTNFKQIEDVIDARKRLGQYNVYKHGNVLNIKRGFCSTFQNPTDVNRTVVKFDETSLVSTPGNIRHTDSEITIVRIKCRESSSARKNHKLNNKWNMMNDIAIPGDGTHLAESPSMVNLATLVSQNLQCEGDDEYLVPLSSWDPLVKTEMQLMDCRSLSEPKLNEKYSLSSSSTEPNLAWKLENSNSATQTEVELEEHVSRRQSWAGKFSKFWRNHWRKSTKPQDHTCITCQYQQNEN